MVSRISKAPEVITSVRTHFRKKKKNNQLINTKLNELNMKTIA